MGDTRERRGEDVGGVSNLPVHIEAIARPGLLRRVRRCVSFSKSKGSAAGLNRLRGIPGNERVKVPDSLKPANREEERLLAALDSNRLPQHIAIIMDGNGRWAQRRHLPRVAGHRAGVQSARAVIETCARLDIPALTLYAFSLENWRRPKAEIDFLMRLLREYLRKELPVIHRNNIRLLIIGRPDQLPAAVRSDVERAMAQTAGNSGMKLIVALNYGGRAELVDAFNRILDGVRHNGLNGARIDEGMISQHLYTAGLPDPDLLIRTSGEMRVSNFLLWQIAYAEIYVTDTLWPDFTRTQLYEALLEFQKRERRYGGLAETRQRVTA
jgi:undecaprenyl diphosphate synthase